jgi:hypothetical protein
MLKRKESYEKIKEKILRERYGDKYVDLILGFAQKHGSTIKMDSLENILRIRELMRKEK